MFVYDPSNTIDGQVTGLTPVLGRERLLRLSPSQDESLQLNDGWTDDQYSLNDHLLIVRSANRKIRDIDEPVIERPINRDVNRPCAYSLHLTGRIEHSNLYLPIGPGGLTFTKFSIMACANDAIKGNGGLGITKVCDNLF